MAFIFKTTNVVSGTIRCCKHCMITHDNSALLHPGKAEYETNVPKLVFAISDKSYLHIARDLNANKCISGKKSGDF